MSRGSTDGPRFEGHEGENGGVAPEGARAEEQQRLEAAEARFRRLADTAVDFVWVVDHEGRFTYANRGSVDVYGLLPSELIGRRFTEFSPPEQVAKDIASLRAGVRGLQYLTKVTHRDGREVVLLANVEVTRNAAGDVVETFGTSRVVHGQTTTELLLHESRERLELLSRTTSDVIWDWDLRRGTYWYNHGYQKLLGIPAGTILGDRKHWEERVHPDDREHVAERFGKILSSNDSECSCGYRFRRDDGTYAFMLDRAQIVRDAAGEAVRILGRMTDISEQQEAGARIREQGELIDQATDVIVTCDLDWTVRTWNNGAQKTLGWTKSEIVGQIGPDVVGVGSLRRSVLEILLVHGAWTSELEVSTKAGSRIWLEVRLTLVREAGQPRSILIIASDITVKRELERQALRTQRLESIGTLAGGIAHDLNNVLQPILLSSELLRLHVKEGPAREMIAALETSAKRGVDMVKQVLSFARGIETDRLIMDPQPVAREVARIAQDTFPRSIHTELHCPEDIWTILGSPTQLTQILLNLALNARDAMPDGGTITLKLENAVLDDGYIQMNPDGKPGPHVVIEVTDDGLGIPKEIQDRVFEPFFTTKEVGKGTGLGLSTVLGIVKSHGGFVHLYSEPGRGTTFKLYFPAGGAAAAEERALPTEADLPRGGGELVLVVDDDAAVRDAVERTLTRYGYRVLLAPNGAEAVSIFGDRKREIALVITDMAMPVMDGPSTIVALKKIDPLVRIVGSSGISADGLVAKASAAGVHRFIPKPYGVETVLRTIRAALEENTAASTE